MNSITEQKTMSSSDDPLQHMMSLSRMLPQESVQSLKSPMHSLSIRSPMAPSKMSTFRDHSSFRVNSALDQKSISVMRNNTVIVMQLEYQKTDRRDFYDYFDFDEFEDEIGRGEFGVVYKCKKVDDEDDDDDDFEFNDDVIDKRLSMNLIRAITNDVPPVFALKKVCGNTSGYLSCCRGAMMETRCCCKSKWLDVASWHQSDVNMASQLQLCVCSFGV